MVTIAEGFESRNFMKTKMFLQRCQNFQCIIRKKFSYKTLASSVRCSQVSNCIIGYMDQRLN